MVLYFSGTTRVPALTQYKNWTSVAVLDVTKTAAQYWLERKVSAVVDKYGIDGLFIDLGTAHDLPHFHEFSKPLPSSDYYKDLFLRALRPIQHVRTIGVSSAVKLPKLPTFVSLSPTGKSMLNSSKGSFVLKKSCLTPQKVLGKGFSL